jgi:hypothetical protein
MTVGGQFGMGLETNQIKIVEWNVWIVVKDMVTVLLVAGGGCYLVNEKRFVATTDAVDVCVDVDDRDGVAEEALVDCIEGSNTVYICTTKR